MKTKKDPQHPGTSPASSESEGEFSDKVKTYRRRQESISEILDNLFGRSANCNPDLWERRTYLMLVGMVYERLAGCEAQISTDDLIALAKMLAENRRVELSARKARLEDEHDGPTIADGTEASAHVEQTVRQVYGLEMTDSQAPRDAVEQHQQGHGEALAGDAVAGNRPEGGAGG